MAPSKVRTEKAFDYFVAAYGAKYPKAVECLVKAVMCYHEPFPAHELESRLAAVCKLIAEWRLDGLIVAVPENIYYLTGLAHWGFFVCHILIVSPDGEPLIAARAMEGPTVANQVRNTQLYRFAVIHSSGHQWKSVVALMRSG